VVAQVPAGEAFSERDLREIGREVREISDEAQVVFSVLVADPDALDLTTDVRGFAEQAHAAIGARARDSVLILVAPNARRVEIVTGSGLRGRLSDRDCALAALSMTSSLSGGDLAGGILQGVRMLGQRAGKPRRQPSTVAPGRTLISILKP
jgi:uncharacterized membrane protein YgcG